MAGLLPTGSFTEVWIYDAVTDRSQKVFTAGAGERAAGIAWSADDTALAVEVRSLSGFSTSFPHPTTSGIRLIPLDGGAPQEIFRSGLPLAPLAFDRAGGTVIAASAPGDDHSRALLAISRDGSFVRTGSTDACAVRANDLATLVAISHPQCFNLPGRPDPAWMEIWVPTGGPAPLPFHFDLGKGEGIVSFGFRPLSQDLVILIAEADRRRMRLEIWPDGASGVRRMLGAFATQWTTRPVGSIHFHPDGSQMLVNVKTEGTTQVATYRIDFKSGAVSSRTPSAAPWTYLIADPNEAARVARLIARPATAALFAVASLAPFTNDQFHYAIRLPSPYRRSDRLSVLASEPGVGTVSVPDLIGRDVFTARSPTAESDLSACDGDCPIWNGTVAVSVLRNPSRLTALQWVDSGRLRFTPGQRLEITKLGGSDAIKVTGVPRTPTQYLIAFEDQMLWLYATVLPGDLPPGASDDRIATAFGTFQVLKGR